MKTETLPLIRPDVHFDEVATDIRAVLESGQLTGGRYVADFEHAVASWVGVRHAVAVTSATTALHLSLVLAGVGPGDEVAISDFTFPATANVVLQQGAVPVLVDSRVDGFDLDPADLEARMTDRTRAIIAVDPFGQPADHRAIDAVARRHGVPVIADAACSLGASRDGVRCGAHADLSCFSFHPRKLITCGEGGMLLTDDAELADRARLLRSHAARRTDAGIVFEEPGFNYRMSEIQAVLGLAQMRRIDAILAERRRICGRYEAGLAGVEGVLLARRPAAAEWSYQSFVVVLADGIDRSVVVRRLAAQGIESTIGTYACHQHPAFQAGRRDRSLVNSARWADQALTLPVVAGMDDTTIDRVVAALAEACR